MKSVAKLRRIGFTIAAPSADDAVDCTKVTSNTPFYYFNPNFASTPREIYEKLKQAEEVSPGVFELLIAGEHFGDRDELPFTVILPASQASLAKYYRQYEAAKAEVDRLKKQVEDAEALVTDELETFEALTKSIIEG